MTGISENVTRQYFASQDQVIRLAPTQPQLSASTSKANLARGTIKNAWSVDEHNRFLEALERFPSGPWRYIAMHVSTRTTRQTMAHAQKYRERIARQRQAQAAADAARAGVADLSSALEPFAAPLQCTPSDESRIFMTEFEADLAMLDSTMAIVSDEDEDQLLLRALDSTASDEIPLFSHEEAQWMVEHSDLLSVNRSM